MQHLMDDFTKQKGKNQGHKHEGRVIDLVASADAQDRTYTEQGQSAESANHMSRPALDASSTTLTPSTNDPSSTWLASSMKNEE